jgi:hypothetical protein
MNSLLRIFLWHTANQHTPVGFYRKVTSNVKLARLDESELVPLGAGAHLFRTGAVVDFAVAGIIRLEPLGDIPSTDKHEVRSAQGRRPMKGARRSCDTSEKETRPEKRT